MNSRRLRWLVLGFACLWFGMLVPVHQRGLVKLPGADAPASTAPTHCSRASDADSNCRKRPQASHETGAGSAPTPDGCAVCHYVLGLHVPPPAAFDVAPLGLLRERVPDEPTLAPARHAALPFHGLDPPTA